MLKTRTSYCSDEENKKNTRTVYPHALPLKRERERERKEGVWDKIIRVNDFCVELFASDEGKRTITFQCWYVGRSIEPHADCFYTLTLCAEAYRFTPFETTPRRATSIVTVWCECVCVCVCVCVYVCVCVCVCALSLIHI